MEKLVSTLQSDYPDLTFVSGPRGSWSARLQQLTYTTEDTERSIWTLLHELGHGLLQHTSYDSDLQLLQYEVAAWDKANILARKYGIKIDQNHVQDCLDTYRDWLHKRSTCPACGDHGLQPTQSLYRCLNCQYTWKVSSARFCRPYRLKNGLTAK